jgi:hypothetical protein
VDRRKHYPELGDRLFARLDVILEFPILLIEMLDVAKFGVTFFPLLYQSRSHLEGCRCFVELVLNLGNTRFCTLCHLHLFMQLLQTS